MLFPVSSRSLELGVQEPCQRRQTDFRPASAAGNDNADAADKDEDDGTYADEEYGKKVQKKKKPASLPIVPPLIIRLRFRLWLPFEKKEEETFLPIIPAYQTTKFTSRLVIRLVMRGQSPQLR